ncbi:MAG: YsnF/AvaK domain-containing protein [Pseudobdellovibrionaceae bacterium]|nr:YsnF/AvaK domain-containing protein [Pseudobdellovibrionaceae bacterium]
METNSRTVVGTFPTFTYAQKAADHLYQSGFSRVRITRHDLESASAHDPKPNASTENQSKAHADPKRSEIDGIFSRLFGTDETPLDENNRRQHLVVVENCDNPIRCRDIMCRMGGSVDDPGSRLYERENVPQASGTINVSASDQVMNLHEEILDVHVERVQSEVSVRKEIVTEMKTVQVPVSREEIVVERLQPEGVDRDGRVEGARRHAEHNQEIRIPVTEEQIHIEKKVVPSEEVRVSKQSVTENDKFSVDVSHEESRLESQGRVKIKTGKLEIPRKSGAHPNENHPAV